MATELMEKIAQIISAHCFWLRLISWNFTQSRAIYEDGGHSFILCRYLVLEVRRRRGYYYPGRRWHIPEPELDLALREMKKRSPAFRRRLSTLTITIKDVERMVEIASNNRVLLDMIE